MKKMHKSTSPATTPAQIRLRLPLALLAMLAPMSSYAAALAWDGGGADDNWSTFENWNPDATVALSIADTLAFGDTGKTAVGTAGNIVSESVTIRTLTYNNSGTSASDWQVTQINSGQTLTIGGTANGQNGNLTVGATSAATLTTNARITGAGSLQLGHAGRLGTFTFAANGGNAAYSRATLDLSGLSSFTAYTSDFTVGANAPTVATLTLAQSNSITTNTLTIGSQIKNGNTGQGEASVLNLGHSNVINADTIKLGRRQTRTSATLQFAGTGGSVVIRGTAGGDTRANLTIGEGGDGNHAPLSYLVDFTDNTVDARFGTLTVGYKDSGNATYTGAFSMNAGTVDATTVNIGRRVGGAGTLVATLNVNGGAFTAGSIELGSTNNTSGVNATLNITGGGVTLGGNIAEGSGGGTGTVTSTLTLNGGTLDLGGHSVAVDAFNVQSGTLRNLGQFNSGATLAKTTVGALTLDGVNAYSGNTSVNDGSLILASTGSLTFYIGADGISNKVTGAGTATFDGAFVFNLAGASLADGNSWTIADVANQTFSGSFTVAGFTQDNDIWTNGAGLTFSETTGLLTYSAVPEPAAAALAAGVGMMLFAGARRRRS